MNINELCELLPTGLDFLDESFGRAMLFEEIVNNKTLKLPKVQNGKNYDCVLPNGQKNAFCFAIATGNEEFEKPMNLYELTALKKRDFALIFWFSDIRRLGMDSEELKFSITKYLTTFVGVDLKSIVDEDAEKVFAPFDIDNLKTQYMMFPNLALRFNFELSWTEKFCI